MAVSDTLASIDVEQRHVDEQFSSALTDCLLELLGGNVVAQRERQVKIAGGLTARLLPLRRLGLAIESNGRL